jgi:hypothetical protein
MSNFDENLLDTKSNAEVVETKPEVKPETKSEIKPEAKPYNPEEVLKSAGWTKEEIGAVKAIITQKLTPSNDKSNAPRQDGRDNREYPRRRSYSDGGNYESNRNSNGNYNSENRRDGRNSYGGGSSGSSSYGSNSYGGGSYGGGSYGGGGSSYSKFPPRKSGAPRGSGGANGGRSGGGSRGSSQRSDLPRLRDVGRNNPFGNE